MLRPPAKQVSRALCCPSSDSLTPLTSQPSLHWMIPIPTTAILDGYLQPTKQVINDKMVLFFAHCPDWKFYVLFIALASRTRKRQPVSNSFISCEPWLNTNHKKMTPIQFHVAYLLQTSSKVGHWRDWGVNCCSMFKTLSCYIISQLCRVHVVT